MPYFAEIDRLRYQASRAHRRGEETSILHDQRLHLVPDWNAQGHRLDCVCRTCFEAYLRRGKVVG